MGMSEQVARVVCGVVDHEGPSVACGTIPRGDGVTENRRSHMVRFEFWDRPGCWVEDRGREAREEAAATAWGRDVGTRCYRLNVCPPHPHPKFLHGNPDPPRDCVGDGACEGLTEGKEGHQGGAGAVIRRGSDTRVFSPLPREDTVRRWPSAERDSPAGQIGGHPALGLPSF